MEITEAQFHEHIAPLLPVQRGNVKVPNLDVLNAILYVAENGCKWRRLPEHFGPWHTIYMRMNRWSKKGVLDRVFARLQELGLVRLKLEVVGLDSTIVPVHPDGTGAQKKNGPQAIGRSRGGWTTKLHLVAADDRTAVIGALSPGQAGDAPQGRQLLQALGPLADHERLPADLVLVMDRAYEGDETRSLAERLGFQVVVPPRANRREPWDYDRELYKQRNEVERLFRRLKGFRRVYTRYDKLDRMFWAFVQFALIVEALKVV